MNIFTKINWRVRVKNPIFWSNIAAAIVLPILAYFGLSWSDITTWSKFLGIFIEAVKNPVVVTSVIVAVWNAINDPTTSGITDSAQALEYTKPKEDK